MPTKLKLNTEPQETHKTEVD